MPVPAAAREELAVDPDGEPDPEDGGDEEALQVLLTYNGEDVLNLPVLEARLVELESTYARRD